MNSLSNRSKAAASMVKPKLTLDEDGAEDEASTGETLGGLLVGLSGNEDLANLSDSVQNIVKMSKRKPKADS